MNFGTSLGSGLFHMNVLNLTKRLGLTPILLLAYIAGTGNALAQNHLYIKGKRDVATNELWKRPPAFRLSANRSHILIEFARRPTNDELAQLRARARVLSYVPDYGFEISITDGQRLAGLPLSWIGRLQPEEKTSPLLQGAAQKNVEEVVVEFHRDVTQSEKREVALRAGVTIHERPDLLPNHLLVRGTPAQLLRLAAWDEVAYMFPASRELKEGVPVATCVGALTQSGPLGQSIPKIGDGWDGPGLGAANLNYAFAADSAKLPPSSEHAEVERAFATWAQYAQLTFSQTGDTTAPQTLTVLFATGQHGDAYPFDGLGTLAHTYYPNPTNPEPIAGDMHFNDGESWRIGADVDLYSVALHEAGHALGLGHSDQPGAVMYPYYKRVTGLSAEDIGAIQNLYAARSTDDPGSGSGSTPAQPSSNNSGNNSGTPSNPVTPVNPPAAPPSAPLALTVTPPEVATSAVSLTLNGTLSGGVAPVNTYWITDQGWSGTIQSVAAWTAPGIPLHAGPNTIAIVAQDAKSARATQIVAVQRPASTTPAPAEPPTANPSPQPPPATPSGTTPTGTTPNPGITPSGTDPSGTDPASTTPPGLDITPPFTTSVYTGKDSIVVKGTASDTVGISSIAWSTSTGLSGVADGTTSWRTPAISLYEGTTTITITATDTAGNTSWRAIVVTRN